jgi:hypothetical protein
MEPKPKITLTHPRGMEVPMRMEISKLKFILVMTNTRMYYRYIINPKTVFTAPWKLHNTKSW